MVYLIFLTFVFASAARQARQPVPLSSRLRAPPLPFHRGSLLPGGWISAKYMLYHYGRGIFRLRSIWRTLFYLSLRGSKATAAIPWSKVICRVLFRGIATLALAMTRKFSRSVIHPPESLPRYARKDNKTKLASSFGGSVGEADDRGLSVILSVSEIFHRKSDAWMPRGVFVVKV